MHWQHNIHNRKTLRYYILFSRTYARTSATIYADFEYNHSVLKEYFPTHRFLHLTVWQPTEQKVTELSKVILMSKASPVVGIFHFVKVHVHHIRRYGWSFARFSHVLVETSDLWCFIKEHIQSLPGIFDLNFAVCFPTRRWYMMKTQVLGVYPTLT